MVDHLVVAPVASPPGAAAPAIDALVEPVPLVDADTQAPDVDRLFREDEALGSVVVATDGGARLLSRTRFDHHMAGLLGFGRAVYARRSIATMLPPHTLHLPSASDLGTAARAVLGRPPAVRYEDLIVGEVDPGDPHAGVVTVRALLEELARQLAHSSLHDPLTGLPNRLLLAEHVRALEESGRSSPVMLYVDLDNFKPVNDEFGHDVGDAVLAEFAGRLQGIVEGRGVAARVGGDEFALLLSDVGAAQAMAVAEQVVLAANSPFLVGQEVVSVGASVGVAGLAADPSELREVDAVGMLLRRADAAMYRAKQGGRNRVVNADHTDRGLRVADRLRHALRADAPTIGVHYQAIADLRTGTTAGVECLARWSDEELGRLVPGEFVPIAERVGLVGDLSRHVLRAAAADAVGWGTRFAGRVAVNLSPLYLAEAGVVGEVLDILRSIGLPPGRLVVEITESAAVGDIDAAVERIAELRHHGVAVALDDFGTGASSLTLLRRLPVDVIKIDREFVESVDVDLADAALVRMLIESAHLAGRLVCAEGVERESQLAFLTAAGCDLAQGFLLHRPSAPTDVPPEAMVPTPVAPDAPGLPVGAGELTIVLDGAGRITYSSSAAVGLLGFHPAHLVGRHVEDLLGAEGCPPPGVRTPGLPVTDAAGRVVRLEVLAQPLELGPRGGGTVLVLR